MGEDKKVRRLTARRRREQVEKGWILDEEHDHMIPPGWTGTSES
jgi:hypothetical protein